MPVLGQVKVGRGQGEVGEMSEQGRSKVGAWYGRRWARLWQGCGEVVERSGQGRGEVVASLGEVRRGRARSMQGRGKVRARLGEVGMRSGRDTARSARSDEVGRGRARSGEVWMRSGQCLVVVR